MLFRLVRSALLAGFGTVLISCFYTTDTTVAESRPVVTGVSVEQLWRQPDRYKDQKVQCLLIGQDYKLSYRSLHWFDGQPGVGPGVVFECDALQTLPDTHTESLLVTGTCRGTLNGRCTVTDCAYVPIRRRLP